MKSWPLAQQLNGPKRGGGGSVEITTPVFLLIPNATTPPFPHGMKMEFLGIYPTASYYLCATAA